MRACQCSLIVGITRKYSDDSRGVGGDVHGGMGAVVRGEAGDEAGGDDGDKLCVGMLSMAKPSRSSLARKVEGSRED